MIFFFLINIYLVLNLAFISGAGIRFSPDVFGCVEP